MDADGDGASPLVPHWSWPRGGYYSRSALFRCREPTLGKIHPIFSSYQAPLAPNTRRDNDRFVYVGYPIMRMKTTNVFFDNPSGFFLDPAIAVRDPYGWMMRDETCTNPEVLGHPDAENTYTLQK